MNLEKRVIAAFDFDGTIISKDSLFDFIAHSKGKIRLLAGLAILSPMLVAYKLGFVANDKAKKRMLSYFFEGDSLEFFQANCESYAKRIDEITIPKAMEYINRHIEQGHELVIVSASVDSWIKPWATEKGIGTVIGTKLEVENGSLTGNFASLNCYGKEKLVRLLDNYPDRASYTLYAYGDSSGDKELLAEADKPFYKEF